MIAKKLTKPKNSNNTLPRTLGQFLILLVLAVILVVTLDREGDVHFDGQRTLQDVFYQTSLGARLPGSEAHKKTISWIVKTIEDQGWLAEEKDTTINNIRVHNIVAKNRTASPEIILGAHYDSRLYADRDPDPLKRRHPVPGANDGASGVAVLLELARVLPKDIDKTVWLVFFDAEDNGNIPGWDWILGSQAFVRDLAEKPDAVVIIDMIGDQELNIHHEKNSDIELTKEIWEIADKLGYAEFFIPSPKYSILDDHTPFLQAGIQAIDIIDFDYAYHHTTQDTPDKVSAKSLQIVGDVLLSWLLQK